MATKTFYITQTAASAPGWFGLVQEAAIGSAYGPSGWAVGNADVSTPYCRARIGAVGTSTTVNTTSFIASASGPIKGFGTSVTQAGDSFTTPIPYSGTFAAGAWALSFRLRGTGTTGGSGRINCRVWASVNQDGSAARELTSGSILGTTTSIAIMSQNLFWQCPWNAPQITLNNEYLFFQVEWQTITQPAASVSLVFTQGEPSNIGGYFTTTDWTQAPVLIVGDMLLSTTLGGDLTFAPRPPIDLTGNLNALIDLTPKWLTVGGPMGSAYGRGLYGKGLYSKSSGLPLVGDLAPDIEFGGDLDVLNPIDIAGDLHPVVSLGGALTFYRSMAGVMTPVVAFEDSDLDVTQSSFADLPVYVDLAGDMTAQFVMHGNVPASATLSASMTKWIEISGGIATDVVFGAFGSVIIPLYGDLPMVVTLSGDELAIFPPIELGGDVSPLVSLSANITVYPPVYLTGSLVPQVTFSAYLSGPVHLAGDLRVQPLFGDPYGGTAGGGAELGFLLDLHGVMTVQTTFGGQLGELITLAGNMTISTIFSDGDGSGSEVYSPTGEVIVECGIF